MPRVTQSELAKRLGVSQQAVSFALNNSGTLAEATRQRILDEAARLGYRPNAAARSMLKGRMGSVAILCEKGLAIYLPTSLLSGVHAELNERGLHLVLHHIDTEKLDDASYIPEIMAELAVDGFIVLYEGAGEIRIRELLNRYNIPAIWVNRKEAANCVYPDDFHLGVGSAEYLLSLGHRHAVYIGPEISDESHYSVSDRVSGFTQTFESRGGKVHLMAARSSAHDEETFLSLLRDGGATSCLSYGPADAGFAYITAVKAGLRVPENLSVLSIGSVSDCVGHIPLSVVRIPFYWVGRKAVELLEKRISAQNVDIESQAVEKLQLDERATTARLA